MLRRYKKMPMPELLNESINSTLSRSIITHVTVTLALLALLLFGGPAIHSFTAVMMFGVVLVGTYTSIFIAAPILIYLGVGDHRADVEEKPAKTEATSSDKAAKQPETAKPEELAKPEKTAKPEKKVKPEKPAKARKPTKP
jgi:preprotein translocase subunit SecF